MYQTVKRTIKSIIPRSLLFRYEYQFRFFTYLLYIGNNYECNICSKKLRQFIIVNDHKICPRCGSIQRTRRLFDILKHKYLRSDLNILHFSPSRSLYRLLNKNYPNYTSSDLSDDFIADNKFDITDIKRSNESFDLIICYHILEHVDRDLDAMRELLRVLKNKGTCLIQTPFKEGDIYENSNIKSSEERLIHFGQEDHVRVYSINGLKGRLEQIGFNVTLMHFNEKSTNRFGFKENEYVLICEKDKEVL